MNIFLVGGASPFVDELISKLNKNGHKVYLLTGKTERSATYVHTFERYDFTYESSSIYEIVVGIQPDVVLFMGAYDTNFDWNDARKESVHFTASLMSILSAYAPLKRGKFLYLSSHEVFADSYAEDIPEDETPSAKNFRALALVQGEEICRNYQEQQNVNCVIVRVDHLYGVPILNRSFYDPCVTLAIEQIRGETISASNQHQISMLHQDDAVEFLYCLLEKEKLEHSVYNLSSGCPITEYQIAEQLAELEDSAPIQNSAESGKIYRQILSPKRFQDEFNKKLFWDYHRGIQKEWRYIQRHKKDFLTDEASSETGWLQAMQEIVRLLVPYLEAVAFIVPTYFLNRMAVQNTVFDGLDLYLLYELVIAIVHGQQTAVFASFLAVGGYLLQQSAHLGGMLSGLLDYKTYLWMAQLLIVGMAVGYLKDQIQDASVERDREIDSLKVQLKEIETINDSNVRMKQMYEQQIINQKDSLGKIYEITNGLEKKSPEEVLFYAARVLSELMGTRDTAVYIVANDDYARLFSFTSEKARKLGNSICYTQLKTMNQELQSQSVFINRELDEHYPMMACGIYANDKMQMILMLWGLPWEKMNLAETNRLRVVSYLIQNAMLRAREYLDALQNQRYLKNSRILNETAFKQLVNSFLNARNNRLTECSLLTVKNVKVEDQLGIEKIERNLRQSDYMGSFHGTIYILLSNTNDAGAQSVIERLEKAEIEAVQGKWEM